MSTKGIWYPDRSKATEVEPPLYLHISATTPEILQKAIDKVNELIHIDMGSLVEDKKDRMRERVCLLLYHRMVCFADTALRENGQKSKFQLDSIQSGTLTSGRKSWGFLEKAGHSAHDVAADVLGCPPIAEDERGLRDAPSASELSCLLYVDWLD